MENDTTLYRGQLRPYWLPCNQSCQPPVLVLQIPVPVSQFATSANENATNQRRTYKKELYKGQKNSKSEKQKCRDRLRKQKFIENKIACSVMPFHELSDEEFRTSAPCKLYTREERLRVQHIALRATTIHLQKENEEQKFLIMSLRKRLSEETEKLQKSVDCERKNAHLPQLRISELKEQNEKLQNHLSTMITSNSLLKQELTTKNLVKNCLKVNFLTEVLKCRKSGKGLCHSILDLTMKRRTPMQTIGNVEALNTIIRALAPQKELCVLSTE